MKWVLTSIALLTSLQANAICYIVSGLQTPTEIQNQSFWSTQQAISQFDGCETVGSWKELLEKTKHKTGDVIDIRLIAHGNASGASICDRATESIDDILNALDQIASKNSVGADLESCYSGQIMLEKIKRDESHPKNASIDHLCLYTASIPGRPALTGRRSLKDVLFDRKALRGKTFEELYLGTDIGLLSGAPYSSAGLPALLRGDIHPADAKHFLSYLNELPNPQSLNPCLAQEACSRLDSQVLLDMSSALQHYSKLPYLLPPSFSADTIIASYRQLISGPNADFFRSYVTSTIPGDYPSPRDLYLRCDQEKSPNAFCVFCKKSGVSSAIFDLLQTKYQLDEILARLTGNPQTMLTSPLISIDDYKTAFLVEMKKKTASASDVCTNAQFILGQSNSLAPNYLNDVEDETSISPVTVLGTFNRLALSSADATSFYTSDLDRRRRRACQNLRFDDKGDLTGSAK